MIQEQQSVAAKTQTTFAVARALAAAFAVVSALILMGLIDLFTLLGWASPEYVWAVPLEASWGALFTFFLAGAYGWIAVVPRVPWPALVQLGIVAVALLVSSAAGTDLRPGVVAAGVVGSALALWLLLDKPRMPSAQLLIVRWLLVGVTALGVPLWLPYVMEAFTQSRAGVLGSITQGIEHWPVQGAVGIAIVVAALVLSVYEAGRPLLRVAVSLSAVYIGMAELAYPDRAGAMGSVLWGVGVTLWGLFIALIAVPPPSRATQS